MTPSVFLDHICWKDDIIIIGVSYLRYHSSNFQECFDLWSFKIQHVNLETTPSCDKAQSTRKYTLLSRQLCAGDIEQNYNASLRWEKHDTVGNLNVPVLFRGHPWIAGMLVWIKQSTYTLRLNKSKVRGHLSVQLASYVGWMLNRWFVLLNQRSSYKEAQN